METVESIERKMKRQKLFVRFILILLLIALGFLVGWVITQSTYEGIDHHVLDIFRSHKPPIGYA